MLLGSDVETAELLVNMSLEGPSWWVWVTEEMVPSNFEERSGIDNENYVIVSEEYVVDAVANFMARCIVSNSKAQVPRQFIYLCLFVIFQLGKIAILVPGLLFYVI